MHLGRLLQACREEAGRSQKYIADQLSTSQGTVSRLETNSEPDEKDAIAYLRSVGTDKATELADYVGASWEYVPKVDFNHPDREALAKAEHAHDLLAGLKSGADTGPLNDELELYQAGLEEAVEYLSSLRHTVSFIGSIGVGKTSALCQLIGLMVDDKPALSYGAGRTTLCEVRVLEGPEYGLIVEPLPDQEISQIVEDFCDLLILRSEPNTTKDEEEDPIDLSVELTRCLRNMTRLTQVRDRETKTVRDTAVELAQQCESKAALKHAVLSRLNLGDRSARELWHSSDKGKALPWLAKTFADINHGRDPSFSIPKCIRVVVPRPVLRATPNQMPFSVSIVDTKGLDDLTPRSDVKEHLDDERTVNVLCSRFESAPDGNISAVLGFACDIGIREKLARDSVLLLLEREGEAVQVNDFDGMPVASREDGREVKTGEVEDQISKDPLKIQHMDIRFFDHKSDDPDEVLGAIVRRIRAMRDRFVERIDQMERRLEERHENFNRLAEEAAMRDVTKDIRAWLNQAAEETITVAALRSNLTNTIGRTHVSSVRASVSRRGSWQNLDYYDQIAFGARADVVHCYMKTIDELRAILRNKLAREDIKSAHTFVREVLSLAEKREQVLLERSEITARASYEEPLREDDPLWAESRDRWGAGPGYRDDIRAFTKHWLDKHANFAIEVQRGLEKEWEVFLKDLGEAVAEDM